MKPFYSIIIPAYNASETVEESLESVAAQNFSNFEIIITNDGSEDNTSKLIEDFQNQHPLLKIQIIHQRNQGLGAARNAAIKKAKGQYCALLDADDIWSENKLDSCFSFLSQSPDCDVLYHEVETFGLDKEVHRKGHGIETMADILLKGSPIVPSASIIKTDVLQAFLFKTDPAIHGAEDLDIWLRLLHAQKHFRLWPEVLTYYREEGGMSTDIEDHLTKVLQVYEIHYQQKHFNRTILEQAKARKYYEVARFYQKRGEHHKAGQYYSAADAKSMKILGLRFLNFVGISW